MSVPKPGRRLVPLGWTVAALIAAASLVAAQSDSNLGDLTVDDLLQRTMGFSADDMEKLDAGSAVVNSLDTPVRQELAHVGVVYVDAPTERLVERFRDIERFERGPGIPQIGRFSSPPQIEDLASLKLPADDVDDLRTCRPGDCKVQFSAEAIDRFRSDVDWASENASDQADAVARELLLALVREYQTDGNAALGRYDDGSESMLVAEQFRALLASDDPLPVPVPALLAYLDEYPRARPAGTEDFFYWSVVDFGLRLTIRVNHVAIYPLDASRPPGVAYAIAIKQLYAAHYFHTTLELRFLVEDHRRFGGPGVSLVSITRSRNDGMTGFMGLFLRPIISRRSRDGVRGYLEHVKRQVEG